ncbi:MULTISPECIES: cytochrome c maturation protein CcmE [Photorhabdus]|uniref:cytochrome c maturation protein CcmE n=1 Tax=Photorhabdus TaxID=29487 RepID=UPI000DCE1AAA|nr:MULTISPECIES: cytochrome c maturation protein CcmE [Photorhabdus]MCT8342773.1 cytochrome c maturation protein CcmE [Photorhabdus kleinii]RAW99496.1 cytochrome c maturation protein CcmE [Photorhabdus sp. S10-54]RAW99602.1 cytochrome c maturation protein CcmE [Photorhabdus sp. S9-53]RAX03809.1 cytochrome c maturation protein CcmE [Photorhabdus sp. S8-52]
MNPRRRNRLYLVIIALISIALTVSLVLYALRSNIDLFYTPSEVLLGKGKNHKKPEIGQRLRIGGTVMPGSVKRDPQTLKVNFKIYDAQGTINVIYDGILPDLFREEQSVIAQGVLEKRNVVNAHEILAKHDEKYMPPEITEAMTENDKEATSAYITPQERNRKS